MNTQAINSRNQRSINALKAAEGDELHIKEAFGKSYSNKTGMLFFVCGNTRGYVSEKAAEMLRSGAKADAFQVSEIESASGEWITTMSPAGREDVFTL